MLPALVTYVAVVVFWTFLVMFVRSMIAPEVAPPQKKTLATSKALDSASCGVRLDVDIEMDGEPYATLHARVENTTKVSIPEALALHHPHVSARLEKNQRESRISNKSVVMELTGTIDFVPRLKQMFVSGRVEGYLVSTDIDNKTLVLQGPAASPHNAEERWCRMCCYDEWNETTWLTKRPTSLWSLLSSSSSSAAEKNSATTNTPFRVLSSSLSNGIRLVFDMRCVAAEMEVLSVVGLSAASAIALSALNIDVRRRGQPSVAFDDAQGTRIGAGIVLNNEPDNSAAKTLRNEALAIHIFSGTTIAFGAASAAAWIASIVNTVRRKGNVKKAILSSFGAESTDGGYQISLLLMMSTLAMISMIVLAALNISHENGDSCAPELTTNDWYYALPIVVIVLVTVSFLWAYAIRARADAARGKGTGGGFFSRLFGRGEVAMQLQDDAAMQLQEDAAMRDAIAAEEEALAVAERRDAAALSRAAAANRARADLNRDIATGLF